MKKLLVMLLALAPIIGFSQYIQIATHYDAETTAHHIIHGHVNNYLNDSVRFVTEKKPERYIIKEDMLWIMLRVNYRKHLLKVNLSMFRALMAVMSLL